jgi:hypothetical protein
MHERPIGYSKRSSVLVRLVPVRVDEVCIGKPEHRGKRKGLRHVSIRVAGDPLGLGAGLELGTAGSSAMASCTSD